MNLLLFIPSLADGKGGAERVAGELGTAMRRRGHRVAYAFDTTFNEGRPQYPVPPDAPLLTYNASFLSQVHLREKIAALGPDLILVFYALCKTNHSVLFVHFCIMFTKQTDEFKILKKLI